MQRLEAAIALIDERISRQLDEIMHAPRFLELEASWRGLHYLVTRSETGELLKVRVLNTSKRGLRNDLIKAISFSQTFLFKRIFADEYGTLGGELYGALIGDFRFGPDDMEMLADLARIAAASFAPFITAVSDDFLDVKTFTHRVGDLAQALTDPKYAAWHALRDSDEARFLCLTLPRALGRLPYGKQGEPGGFTYVEATPRPGMYVDQGATPPEHCWMNAAYLVGAVLARAFARDGWWASLVDVEDGGMVDDLPGMAGTAAAFAAEDRRSIAGKLEAVRKPHFNSIPAPTDVHIREEDAGAFCAQGFLPVFGHTRDTMEGGFSLEVATATAHKPRQYDRPEATANAAIWARLPCVMALSRFAHYLTVMGRDKAGSFMTPADCERWLNAWISGYVNPDGDLGPEEAAARYPIHEARIRIEETGATCSRASCGCRWTSIG